jgi:hypothetical protein
MRMPLVDPVTNDTLSSRWLFVTAGIAIGLFSTAA